MKKEYIKPEFTVQEILPQTMMTTSVPQGQPGQQPGAIGRRDGWDDPWN